jgi:hypothetical protein
MALTDKLSAIADAIRGKTGKTDTLTLDQMPTEIAGIQAGGGGGIGAVKFVDEDIMVEESTSTAVTYTIDGVQIPTFVENPTKWSTYTGNEVYIVFITPKEIVGEYTATDKATASAMITLFGHTNYAGKIVTAGGYHGGSGSNVKPEWSGFVKAGINSTTAVTDGVPYASVFVTVQTNVSSGWFVPAGTYNVQFWMLTDFNWGM